MAELIITKVENILTFTIGLLVALGTLYYLFVSRSHLILALLRQLKWKVNAVFIDPRITNYETITQYLYSNNYDNYIAAFKYIPQHSRFPNHLLEALVKIILNKKPFNTYKWIDVNERIRVLNYLCLMMIKNKAAIENTQTKDLELNICRPVKDKLQF